MSDRSTGPSPRLTMPLIRARVGERVSRDAADKLWLADAGAEPQPEPARRAAVATILRDGPPGPEVLLIRRAENPADPWSGHMAFPGGREDPRDPDLFATAVRETREEVALDLTTNARLLGRLDNLPAIARGRRTGMVIAPFVFELTGPAQLTPNYEIAEVLWAPLEPLLRGQLATSVPYELEGQRFQMPAYRVGGHAVWGLTYRMLENLFALLR